MRVKTQYFVLVPTCAAVTRRRQGDHALAHLSVVLCLHPESLHVPEIEHPPPFKAAIKSKIINSQILTCQQPHRVASGPTNTIL